MPAVTTPVSVRIPLKWWLLSSYLLLLVASWTVETVQRHPAPARPSVVEVRKQGLGLPTVIVSRLPERHEGSVFVQQLIAKTPTPVWRLSWPDAASGSKRDDASTQAMAKEVPELLRAAGIVGPVHLVGEGMGGVVATEVAAREPNLVRSLTLVNAPGSQEYTLLGNAVANKFVYFFHHIPFVLADNLLPHFGGLNYADLNRSYSAVFFASDLSENRAQLRAWQGPLLLLHGEDNWVTPVDASRSTQRLAPQAQLQVVAGGRELADPAAAAQQVVDFQAQATAGKAPVRRATTPVDAPWPELVTSQGARFWILLGVIAVCTFVAEDPTCLAAGLLAAEGIVPFWWAALACTVGIFIGDMVLYLIGFTLGRRALRHAPLRWMVQEHEIDRMAGWFSSPKGLMVIVSSRFIPASRVPTFVTAGILRLSLAKLGFLLLVAALIWTPVLMWLGHTFGPPFMAEFPKYKQHAAWIILGVFLGIWLLTHWCLPLATHRGRREVRQRLTFLISPAFWPTWLVLLPTRAALYLKALLRRRLTVASAANPGWGRLGGALGDSKSDLLEPFARDPRTCPYLSLPSGVEALAAAEAFAAREGFPLALKPEVAQDGAGLIKLLDLAALRAALVPPVSGAWILQPWVTGKEFELVWRREPGAEVGELVAVVEKVPVEVVGDGRRPLEHLIWDDPKVLLRADLYQRLHTSTLLRIPAAGEGVRLDLSGAWSHGAKPTRRPALEVASLRDALDTYCRQYPGLHHARLDVRAASEQDLVAGRFKVTEIEGAGTFSSALRDPQTVQRVAFAARQLETQFRVGHTNLDQGLRQVALAELLARRSEATGRTDGFRITD